MKCTNFLIDNGYIIKEDNEDFISLSPPHTNCSDIEICKDEIVFIGEIGDWLHIPLNYFALLGAMIDKHQIGVGYKQPK
jgi:hypothetical protein